MILQNGLHLGAERGTFDREDCAHVLHAFCDEHEYAMGAQLLLCKGLGCRVTDVHGARYLDVSAGLWNVSLGYGREDIIAVIDRQLRELCSYHLFAASHKPAVQLAHCLLAIAGTNFCRVFFTNSGSEAIDSAIKLSRQYQQLNARPSKRGVMFFERAYHGSTFGAMAANSNRGETAPYGPLPEAFIQMPAPPAVWCSSEHEWDGIAAYIQELDLLFAQHAPHTACILIEPIQGVGGVRFPPKRVFEAVQRFAAKHDIVVICDEIASGCYRTGSFLSFQERGLCPDLVCLGKGLTSGYQPLASVLLSSKLANVFQHGGPDRIFYNGFTSGGHPAACACASAVLGCMVSEAVGENARAAGEHIIAYLRSLPAVEEARGVGLMIAISLKADFNNCTDLAIWQKFRKAGLLVRVESGQIIYMPPLTISKPETDELFCKSELAITRLSRSIA